jgi:DNA-binding LacI/PurR family transcriptional regulator
MDKKPTEPASKPETAPPKRVTLRDIAQELGISHVTVSKALRNQSGASEKLKIRVRQKAEEMGYTPDPMLSALSSYRQTSKGKPIQSELAWINTWPEPEKLRQQKEFDLYWEGAYANAKRLGYHLEAFNTAEIPLNRLETILKTRNIQGILIPPIYAPISDFDSFDWSSFAVMRFGNSVPLPKTHFVTSAQMMDTMLAFNRILELGYQRIGFVCEYWHQRLFAGGFSWAQKQLPSTKQIPPLTLNRSDPFEQHQKTLDKWLKQHNPDAILTDKTEVLLMIRNLGYRIPEDIGIATTSIHDTPIDAGIDQRPFEIGQAAIRMLTALIAEQNFGIPDCRTETLIEGNWVDGPMMPARNVTQET